MSIEMEETLNINPNFEFLQNTEFLDKLIDNTAKISTKINKNKIFNFLESSIFSLRNSKNSDLNSENDEDQNLKNLDEYQIWAIIENSSKNIFSELNKMIKAENQHKEIIKELKNQNTLLNYELLKIKRKSSENNDDIQMNSKQTNLLKNNAEQFSENEKDSENFENTKSKKLKKNKKENLIQDKFFDLEEFNNIGEDDMAELDLEEDGDLMGEDLEYENEEDLNFNESSNQKKSGKKSNTGVPEQGIKYEDFFNDEKLPKKSKKNNANNEDADEEILDEDIEDNIFDLENKLISQDFQGIKKTYEFDENQTKTIDEIERSMLENKSWQMKGEIKAKERPKESLLENYLDFQVSIKPPPIPSAEMTSNIEKMIKLRIKEELFDDPIRNKEINLNKKNKEEIELDFQKSKKGLGEIYEDDYNKEIGNATESEAKEIYKEIDELTNKLYTIFDKLTNNSFVSGNRNTEMKVLTNVPSIQLEDISNFVTDNKSYSKSANELYSRKDLETKTKNEMSKEEKEKLHKHTKRNIRNRLREKQKNQKMKSLMNKLDSKFEAKFAMKQMKDKSAKSNVKNSELKSSKFFGNLQNIASDDKEKKDIKSKRREANSAASGEALSLGNGDAKKFKI